MSSPIRIVITGGPGTGKTSVIRELEKRGHHCYHEIIRDMTAEAKNNSNPDHHITNPLLFVDDPLVFNRKLLDGRLHQHALAGSLSSKIAFYDRGLPDVIAYMHYFKQSYDDYFTRICHQYRYDEVMILPPWEHIYTEDEERLETFEEATLIHHELEKTYSHLVYIPLDIHRLSVEERIDYIDDILTRMK